MLQKRIVHELSRVILRQPSLLLSVIYFVEKRARIVLAPGQIGPLAPAASRAGLVDSSHLAEGQRPEGVHLMLRVAGWSSLLCSVNAYKERVI